MKALLLATALIAAPVIAQDAAQTPPPVGSGQGAPGQPAPTTDPATDAANSAAAATAAAEPGPTAAPPAGSQVVFQQPPSVDQAFPPPAPKESYPWCSRTVTDGCKQRVDPK